MLQRVPVGNGLFYRHAQAEEKVASNKRDTHKVSSSYRAWSLPATTQMFTVDQKGAFVTLLDLGSKSLFKRMLLSLTWPLPFSPHVHRCPFSVTAAVCSFPHAICSTRIVPNKPVLRSVGTSRLVQSPSPSWEGQERGTCANRVTTQHRGHQHSSKYSSKKGFCFMRHTTTRGQSAEHMCARRCPERLASIINRTAALG